MNWSASEVIERWHRWFSGSEQSQAFMKGEILESSARLLLDSQIQTWQQRLTDISWFMRVINEKIARKANAVKRRIEAYRLQGRTNDVLAQQPERLEPFVGNPRQDMPAGLAFRVEDYLVLVDWTWRQIREDKRGRIGEALPPILERLRNGNEITFTTYCTLNRQ